MGEAEDVCDNACVCLRLSSLTLASLSMESLAGPGCSIGRAVTEGDGAPGGRFGIPVTHGTEGSWVHRSRDTWGSKGSETAAASWSMSIKAFQKIWVRP